MINEDLKVGMLLKKKFNTMDNVIEYIKIFNILNDIVYYYSYIIDSVYPQSMQCYSLTKVLINGVYNIIDKVPSKIEEIEEDITLYANDSEIEFIKNNTHVSYSIVVCNTKYGTGHENFPINTELCKIKGKVEKTLEFDWEIGEYK
jgi:hypothetical protein